MAGAELLGLRGEEDVGLVAEALADLVGRVADDDDDRLGPGASRRVDDVADHRPAADLVQDLGLLRLHPLAVAGRQDDRNRSLHALDLSDLGRFMVQIAEVLEARSS